MTELPFWQPIQHGSAQWWDDVNRRNRIEGIFGNVKNDAAQNITRGRIRVMGLAKTSLMVLFTLMAANLRLAQTFTRRIAKEAARAVADAAGTPRQTRKPRYHRQLQQQARDRVNAARAIAAEQDARALPAPALRVVRDEPGDPAALPPARP